MATVPASADALAFLPTDDALAKSRNAANEFVSRSNGAMTYPDLVSTSSRWSTAGRHERTHSQANTKGVVLDKQVRVADTASLDLDKDLVLPGELERGFLDNEGTAGLLEDGVLVGLGEGHCVVAEARRLNKDGG